MNRLRDLDSSLDEVPETPEKENEDHQQKDRSTEKAPFIDSSSEEDDSPREIISESDEEETSHSVGLDNDSESEVSTVSDSDEESPHVKSKKKDQVSYSESPVLFNTHRKSKVIPQISDSEENSTSNSSENSPPINKKVLSRSHEHRKPSILESDEDDELSASVDSSLRELSKEASSKDKKSSRVSPRQSKPMILTSDSDEDSNASSSEQTHFTTLKAKDKISKHKKDPVISPRHSKAKNQILDSDSSESLASSPVQTSKKSPSRFLEAEDNLSKLLDKKLSVSPRQTKPKPKDSKKSPSLASNSSEAEKASPMFLEAEDKYEKVLDKKISLSPKQRKPTIERSSEKSSVSSLSKSKKEETSLGFLEAEDHLSILIDKKLRVSPKHKPTSATANQSKITDSFPGVKPSIPVEKPKALSPSKRQDLEEKIKGKQMAIDKNKRLLQSSLSLPDKGVKLRAFIDKLQEDKARMETELREGRETSQNGGIDDSQKIQLLENKLSILKQKYATTRAGDTDQGTSLIKEISKTQRELLQLKSSGSRSLTAMGDLNEPKEKSAWQKVREEGLDLMNNVTWSQWAQGPASNQLYGGRMNQARRIEAISVTQEAIKKLHDSLDTMPVEADMEEDPLLLKKSVSLFPHQKQALAWLLWRESQHPPGGILADDMGLGKTLTMISLILKGKELEQEPKKEEWLDSKEGKSLIRSKGTLIICPASLISQWEGEVRKRLKSDALNVLVYHGSTRGQSARSLARYDLVVTTYHTVMNDLKGVLGESSKDKLEQLGAAKESESSNGIQLLRVAWERLILDEAHQIRNPRSKTAQAVCRLRGAKRWCVTGTPIQNKELDMYSLIRFLRCAPFDEYRAWKTWVDNRTSQGQTRMNTLIKSLLLRRTKEQKSAATGDCIVQLPKKTVLEHAIKLKEEEKKVYDKVFSLSQNAMINYMKKYHEERGESIDLSMRYKSQYGSGQKDVKAHHLLVLLLRLRQICCHPSLIQSMLDTEVKSTEGIEDDDGDDLDLISRMEDMSLAKKQSSAQEEEEKLLISSNPVFNAENASSKIVKLMEALTEISASSEKAVIVSQWTSMLNIVQTYVDSLGLRTVAINGSVPVKNRGEIVESFNSQSHGSPRVMLLSLAAGGVGLNLTGGNHLFLLDLHWNPQLEQQACDRIYRVGQKRPVWIHKFLCEDTVESRIHLLQQKKMSLADGVLTGAKRTGANKLSFEDLKVLFNVK